METPEQDDLPLGYEQPDLWDRLIAFLLGLATTVALWAGSAGALHPGAWNDAAVAARLMPPESVAPGAARIIEAVIFRTLELSTGIMAVNWLGYLAGGMAVFFFYLMLRELLPAVLLFRSESRIWTYYLERGVAIAGALVFIRALPVWGLCQSFTADTLLMVGTLVFARYFLRLLHYGKFPTAYGCLFFLGFMTAESPAGLLFTILAMVVVFFARQYAWRPDLRYLNPMLMEFSKWRLSAFYFLGFALTLAAELMFFVWDGGLAAQQMTYGELAVDWVVKYGLTAVHAASPLGWALMLVFAALPFGVTVLNARHATDDDAFLSFKVGFIFILSFIVSLAPLTSLPYLRFWSWTNRACIASPYMLQLSCMALAVAFSLSMAVLMFDIWVRNHRRIAIQRFPELVTDNTSFEMQRFHYGWRKVIAGFMLLVLVFFLWPGRHDAAIRRMSALIRDVVGETVRELGNAKMVITDGSLDDALRLEAASRGGLLHPLSIMSGRKPYESHLRMLAAENEEEKTVLGLSAADALRNWVNGDAGRFGELGLQLGMELWRGRPERRPPVSGLLARAGLKADEIAAGTVKARELAQRVIDIHASGMYRRCEDRLLRDKFLYAQWRLARFAAFRAEDFDRASKIDESKFDAELSEKLDDLNPELQRVRDAVNWLRNREGDSITPKEGLRIALERADFALARRYATPILNVDRSNPNANFGMGMSYFIEEKYVQAEPYLKAALERRPDEPATLNNLAICCFKTHRYAEALEYSKKALKLLPDAPAVRKTYEEIMKHIH